MLSSTEIKRLAKELAPIVEQAIVKAHIEANDKVLTVSDVAEMLDLSKEAIRRRCREKRIPYKEIDGRYYFSLNSINKYYLKG